MLREPDSIRRFGSAIGQRHEIYLGGVWIEAEQALLFGDIPESRIMRWSQSDGLSVWREHNNRTNGNHLDHQSRLLSCEHESRSVDLNKGAINDPDHPYADSEPAGIG